MEISIKISDGGEGPSGKPAVGVEAVTQPVQEQPAAPPAELAARAAALGAINAGPAEIPDGAIAEPVANIAMAAAGEQESGTAQTAGAAPAQAREPEPIVLDEGATEE